MAKAKPKLAAVAQDCAAGAQIDPDLLPSAKNMTREAIRSLDGLGEKLVAGRGIFNLELLAQAEDFLCVALAAVRTMKRSTVAKL